MRAKITILRADGWVGKRFAVGDDGELIKTSRATISRAKALVRSADTAQELVALIEDLRETDAISTGQIADGRDAAVVVTSGREHVERGEIARTLKYFNFPAGPGWLLIDHDAKAMPDDVAQRVADLGGPVAALESIWPELRTARRVLKPSSSGGVHVAGGVPASATGFHLFVALDDVSRSREALQALQARAWQAGLAWVALAENGARLERSIVDVAVGSPERLIFTAPPRLGPGVLREAPPIVWQEGDVLAPPSMPVADLFEVARSRAFTAAEPAAIERTITARRVDRPTAEAIVRDAHGTDGGELPGELLIWRRNGSRVTVAELVAELRPPVRLSMPDPFEGPSYGTTTATLFWNAGHDAPILVSHAHGVRTIYRLEAPVSPASAVWKLTPAHLPSKRTRDLEDALRACQGDEDAGVVLAVAQALSRRVPACLSLDDVRAFLRTHSAVSDVWIDAVMGRIAKAVSHRQERALAPVTFSTAARFEDDVRHRFVDHLTPLDEIEGIHVVRAPMGTGKTQLIGAPWIAEAKRRTVWGDVWAIAHRRSLIRELAQRLDLAHYEDPAPHQSAIERGGLAICLPSITLKAFAVEDPAFVFVDEIAQVLRFLTSASHCRTRDADAAGVFRRLVEIVRKAKGVLVADAGADDTVLDFLRFCRPGETINVIEVRDTPDAGIDATFFAGSDAVAAKAIDEAGDELAIGGSVWIAVEGAGQAQDVGAHLAGIVGEDAVLVLTADEKRVSARASAFFADPEGESRKYRAIVASPVVSSGLSIEHRTAPHFTLGVFLGSGLVLEPADAAQMLRRVRYLDRFAIGVAFQNRIGGETAAAIIEGREAASRDEGRGIASGSFDRLVAGFQARSQNTRADFSAGLWWQLEAAGWRLSRAGDESEGYAAQRSEIAAQRLAQRRANLIAACRWFPITSAREIEALRRSATTVDQLRLVEAWGMSRALGVAVLTDDDIAFADGGGLARLDLFEDLIERDRAIEDEDDGTALIHRRLRNARRRHLREIFDGFDVLGDGFVLTSEIAETILDRVMARAVAYAASGAIPPRYRARYGAKLATRPANAVRAVQDMLRRAGLGTVAGRRRVPRDPCPVTNEAAPSRDNRERTYTLDPDTVAAMSARLATRNAARRAVETVPELEHVAQFNFAKAAINIPKVSRIYGARVEIEVDTPVRIDVTPAISAAGAFLTRSFPPGGVVSRDPLAS